MRHTTVSITDLTTNATNSYEGVSLDELVSNAREQYVFKIFKESWGLRDWRVATSTDLDLESEIIVADTINGKRLAGDTPF
jgi:hypothetical protein